MGRGGVKWTSLEHRGVTFPSGYTAHGKKLLFKGEAVDLTPEVEEVCNWWAGVLGTEFGENKNVIKNFTESFLSILPKELNATRLEDFDFSLIKQHLEKEKEDKKNRDPAEKKKEQAQREEEAAKYRLCLYSNTIEKVANNIVEPPGIFRGRGEHPNMGKLKSRIVPEFVTINIG